MRTKKASTRIKMIKIFVPQLLLAGVCDSVGVGEGSLGVITLGAEKLNVKEPSSGTSASEYRV